MKESRRARYEELVPARAIGKMAILLPELVEDLTRFLEDESDRYNKSSEVLIYIVAKRAIELDPCISLNQAGDLAAELVKMMQNDVRFRSKLIRWVAYQGDVGGVGVAEVPVYLCIVGAQSDDVDPDREGFLPPEFFEEIARAYYSATQQQLAGTQAKFRLPEPHLDVKI